MGFYAPCFAIDGDADERGFARPKTVGVAFFTNLRHGVIRGFFTRDLVIGNFELDDIMMFILDNLNIASAVITVVFGDRSDPSSFCSCPCVQQGTFDSSVC